MKYFAWLLLAFGIVACTAAPEQQEEHPPPLDKPPEWAKEVVWYQIFLERFRNGDPSNDPTPADMVGTYPGFVPDGWEVTPWTQDWYKPDPYFAALEGTVDENGYPVHHFGQHSQLRRYGGDLQGVFDQLDYLDSLGISAIYFNPLNDAPSLHKYDARHWRHIDRNFGPTPEEDVALMASEVPDDPSTWVMTGADKQFVQLIDELHKRDIRVILDFSWNHTGHKHWAIRDVMEKGEASAYVDWYYIDAFDDPDTPENELAYQGWFNIPSLPEIQEDVRVDHTTAGMHAYEGNLYSEAAKQHIFNVTRKWLDPNGDGDPSDGVDGFRMDVAAEIGLGFWREYREFVRGINPETYIVGEVWWEKWPDQLLDPSPYLAGDVFDAVMNYRWYKALRQFVVEAPAEIPVSALVDSLQRYAGGQDPAFNYAMMNLMASHDTPRVLTSLFNKNKYKYNASTASDETYKIHKPDAETHRNLELMLVQQFTYIGAPHIWAGDEMGMWGADDPSTRKPLIWPDYEYEVERAHPLGLDRPADPVEFNHNLFNTYRKLIQLRNDHPVLIHGAVEYVVVDDANNVLAYSRFDEEDEVLAVFNASFEAKPVQVPAKKEGLYADVLHGVAINRGAAGMLELTVPPRTGVILASDTN